MYSPGSSGAGEEVIENAVDGAEAVAVPATGIGEVRITGQGLGSKGIGPGGGSGAVDAPAVVALRLRLLVAAVVHGGVLVAVVGPGDAPVVATDAGTGQRFGVEDNGGGYAGFHRVRD